MKDQPTLYGHLRGLHAHVCRAAEATERCDANELAAFLAAFGDELEIVLRFRERELRATQVPPKYGKRQAS